MELRDQLEFCRKCENRERYNNDPSRCGLTHLKPSFDVTCPDYKRDFTEPETRLDDEEKLSFSDFEEKLEPSVYNSFQNDQNFLQALLASIFVGFTGAIIWALITYYTEREFGLIAIAIGAGIGLTINYTGNGFEQKFAFLGAGMSFLSCLLGNFLALVGFAAKGADMTLLAAFGAIDFSKVVDVMVSTFGFMDLIFYGLAIYEGYRFATRKYTERSLWTATLKFRNPSMLN
jgi:hypothetical protein